MPNCVEGGTTIDTRICLLWRDKACRLLLGVFLSFAALLFCCLIWGKHLVVSVDGQEIPVIQFRGTVADALAKARVTLREADIVEPSLYSRVADTERIQVTRVTTEEITDQQFVPFGVERKPDRKLAPGQQKVLRYGSYGLSRNYVQVTYQDGKEVKRETLRKVLIRKPQPMVVAYGPNYAVSRSSQRPVIGGANSIPERCGKVLTAVSTAYTHTGHRTATGVYPYEGVVSVDPRVIPLSTKLYVENYGYAVAADTGGGIKGNRIDVFFNTYQQAISWGRRTVKVHILE